MQERNVTVDRGNGGSLAIFGLIAVLVVAGLIGLFVWQPWNATGTHAVGQSSTQSSTTTSNNGTGTTKTGTSP